jgi:alpha-tubulin suppressor-like RCC1 family protein
VTRPTVIKFPRLTRPIISLACGSGHILAITDNYSLYSWGCGANAALGFGSKIDVPNP